LIEAVDISKSYKGKSVLDSVNFSLLTGESAVIVGRNGAGKSTFLSILAGYLRPECGQVSIDKKNAAFCPQDDNLFDELTVKDNLLFWARACESSGSFNNEPAPNLAELFEVETYIHKKVRHLSGGMKKCVAIICALSNNADVLILDEPFSGLDIFYKNTLLSAFRRLKASGKCIIYTSHNLDEIMGLDNKVYTLTNGKLTYMDTLEKDSNYELIRNSLLEFSKP